MKNVLLVLNNNEEAVKAARYTADLAASDTRVTVLLIVNCSDIYKDVAVCMWISKQELREAIENHAQGVLKTIMGAFKEKGITPCVIIETGDPAYLICMQSKKEKYDHLILGGMDKITHKVVKCSPDSIVTIA